MKIKRIYICTFFVLFSYSLCATEVEDFTIACQIFTEAKNTGFDAEKRSAYIEDNINTQTTSNELKDTYNIIFNVSPEERYNIFKQAAEHATKKPWNCPAAKELLR